jgi:hypothetical protein
VIDSLSVGRCIYRVFICKLEVYTIDKLEQHVSRNSEPKIAPCPAWNVLRKVILRVVNKVSDQYSISVRFDGRDLGSRLSCHDVDFAT